MSLEARGMTREQLLVTAGVMAGIAVAALDSTVVGTAMPTIIGQLGGIDQYGWVFAAYLLTATTTVPVFSTLADVRGRKPIFMIGLALFVGGSALCGLSQNIFMLILFRAIQGLGAGAVQPISFTIVGDIFDARERARMQGVFSSVWGVSAIVGPAVGGVVLATMGIAAAYMIDVVTFAAAIVALLMISPIAPAAGAIRPSLATIVEGLRYARSRREVLATFVVDINAMVFGSPRSLYPALALDVFRVGPAGVGLMASAAALGGLMAAVFSGRVTTVRHPGRAVLVAVTVWGMGITAFGLATFSFPLALLFLAIASGADVISAVLRSSIVQLITPDSLRGRVSSIHILVVTGGPRIGDAEASVVAAAIGTQLSVISGGLLTIAGLGAIALAMPEFRRLDMAAGEPMLEALPVPTPPG